MKSLITAVVAFLGIAGCHKQLNPGRCNSTSDCLTGQTCDLTQNGVCVCNSPECVDGGGTGAATGGTGGAVASGGAAGTTTDDGGIDSSDAPHGCQSRSDCSAPTPACGSTGACVPCNVSTVVMDCLDPTKPICDAATNTCVACASDDQCVQRNGADPGVCMAQVDGHCAMPAETIYVQNDTSVCVGSAPTGDPGSGTVTKPLCTMDAVSALVSPGRSLVLVRGTVQGAATWIFNGKGNDNQSTVSLFVLGQSTAHIAGGASAAFAMSAGTAYVHGLELSSGGTGAAVNLTGGTLQMDTVTVDKSTDGIDLHGGSLSIKNGTISGESVTGIDAKGGTLDLSKTTIRNCAGGGILLEGAAFDIENTTVTNCGPSGDDTVGGIRVSSVPSGGTAVLNLVTAQNNNPSGVSCSTPAQGTAVFASGNISSDITPLCGFSSCGAASTACGSQ
jgi:hypothetical protein